MDRRPVSQALRLDAMIEVLRRHVSRGPSPDQIEAIEAVDLVMGRIRDPDASGQMTFELGLI